ncbi:MAG: sulfatase-like hydrolase/transferase [Deltaproteobacteria bacterium]|nr:sulfatase-like hydrolase/transferase [Deltaproteobacteria bacterium]
MGAILVSAAEIWQLRSAQLSPGLIAAIAAVLLSSGAAYGSLLGLWWIVADRAARLIRPNAPNAALPRALLAALTLAYPTIWLVRQLATGRQAAQLIGTPLRRGLIAAALLMLVVAAFAFGVQLARRANARRRTALLVALILSLLTLALHWADAQLYRRLYDYLHYALALTYLSSATLAALAWLRALGQQWAPKTARLKFTVVIAVCALTLCCWVLGRRALSDDARRRFVAAEQATTVAHLLEFLPLPAEDEPPALVDESEPNDSEPSTARYSGAKDANVLLITIDALRPDHLSLHGYRRKTSPQIDALARRSIRFNTAYCQAPLTCYSIPSLHTGDYLRSSLSLLPSPPPTLADILAPRGLATHALYNRSIFFCDDKRAMSYGSRRFGFRSADTELRPAAQLTEQALNYMLRRRDRQFFLWLHYFDVHEPYLNHNGFGYGERAIDRYDSGVAYVDHHLGRLLRGVRQLPRKTIIILTSDHGEEFGEHGGSYHGSSLYDEQVRVPLLIAVPGLAPRVSNTPVQLVDIAPTVLDLLHIEHPPSIRGRSLLPLLLGHKDDNRPAFSEVDTKKMVRVGKYKLIHDYRRKTYQLYDLATDPREQTNKITQELVVAGQLRGQLQAWFDSLRRGAKDRASVPRAIALGRLGDRRAVKDLKQLLLSPGQPSTRRAEAARLLGRLQDKAALPALRSATYDDDLEVADEAAIALGELKDQAAREALQITLEHAAGYRRLRAAIAAARSGDTRATPALIEGLYAADWRIQNRAAHYLGLVGDRRAVPDLIAIAEQLQIRSRAALALGRLHGRYPDPRIVSYLLERIQRDDHEDVRQRAIAAIAYSGDLSTTSQLIAQLGKREEDDPWIVEALARLGRLQNELAGFDLGKASDAAEGTLSACQRNNSPSVEEFLSDSHCTTISGDFSWQLGAATTPAAATWLLRARAANAGKLTLTIDQRIVGSIKLRPGWQNYRLAANGITGGSKAPVRVLTDPPQPLTIDYLIGLPAREKRE